MRNRKVAVAGIAGLCLAVGASGIPAAGSSAAVRRQITIREKASLRMVPNRYIQNGLRWNKDVYRVKSGGTITLVNNVSDQGAHTLSVVRKKDLPRNARQMNHCAACARLARAHGAVPNSNAPPKFQFVENGVGQATAPNLDRPGDSGVTGSRTNDKISFKVTAKKGKRLYFLCLIHPWMQARIQVQ